VEAVKLSEARKRLSELVRAAERGESFSITRRGREVTRIVPVQQKPLRPLPDLAEFRASIEVKGKGLSRTVIDMRVEERC